MFKFSHNSHLPSPSPPPIPPKIYTPKEGVCAWVGVCMYDLANACNKNTKADLDQIKIYQEMN